MFLGNTYVSISLIYLLQDLNDCTRSTHLTLVYCTTSHSFAKQLCIIFRLHVYYVWGDIIILWSLSVLMQRKKISTESIKFVNQLTFSKKINHIKIVIDWKATRIIIYEISTNTFIILEIFQTQNKTKN